MTDDESRKGFEATLPDYVGLGTGDHLIVWQAAVEWATKRERERCAEIAISHYTGPDAAYEIDSEVGK